MDSDTTPLVADSAASPAEPASGSGRPVARRALVVGSVLLAAAATLALCRQGRAPQAPDWATGLRSTGLRGDAQQQRADASATISLSDAGDRGLVLVHEAQTDFYVGQNVHVRDSSADAWKEGTVTRLLPLSVQPIGWEDSFTWKHVQAGPLEAEPSAGGAGASALVAQEDEGANGGGNPIAQGLEKFIHTSKERTTTREATRPPTTTPPPTTTTPPPTTTRPPTTTEAPSCRKYGCVGYTPTHPCQCNIDCLSHGNCCSDYGAQCKAENEAKTTSTTTTPPTTSTKLVTTLPQIASDPSTWGSPSLFCFSLSRTEGYEPDLVKAQYLQGVGIFACDEFAVLSNGVLTLGPDHMGRSVSAILVPAPDVKMGKFGVDGQTTNSWLNTLNFMHAWEALRTDGRIWKHDWTVKVDPDAVLIPDRLRTILKPETPKHGEPLFIANCDIAGPLLYGALEVFSKAAVGMYLDNSARCKKVLDWDGWGEDYYMQQCLQMLGSNRSLHTDIVSDTNCKAVKCSNHSRAAYHPFKSTQSWFDCWGQATELVR